MKSLKVHFVLTGILINVINLFAQNAEIDNYLKQIMEQRRIPGLAVAVIQGNEVIYQNCSGYYNIETNSEMHPDCVFEIASMTKPFTCLAVTLLADSGKLNFDDPISMYIEDIPAEWESITVRNLMNHTAGFQEQIIAEYQGSALMDVSTEQQFNLIKERPLIFKPGSSAHYSDPGYFLLGMIIEKASGKKYGEVLRENIFAPNGMNGSQLQNQNQIIKNRVAPYRIRNGELMRGRRDWQHELPSNYGILSTLNDLIKFGKALNSQKYFSTPKSKQAWLPGRLTNGKAASIFGDNYGFGWHLGATGAYKSVGHGGFSGTFIWHYPELLVTTIVLTNLDLMSGSNPAGIGSDISLILLPELQFPSVTSVPSEADKMTMKNLMQLIKDLQSGNTMQNATEGYIGYITKHPRKDLILDRLKPVNDLSFISSKMTNSEILVRNGEFIDKAYFCKSMVDGNEMQFTFWLTADGKIAHLSFR